MICLPFIDVPMVKEKDESDPSQRWNDATCAELLDRKMTARLGSQRRKLRTMGPKAQKSPSSTFSQLQKMNVSARNDERQRPSLVHCDPNRPGRRHRHSDENSWKEITVGFILAFLSILVLRGALLSFWESPPYAVSLPFVQNLMPRYKFLQMRRYLHFLDRESLPKGPFEQGCHPLQKIKNVLENVQRRMQFA